VASEIRAGGADPAGGRPVAPTSSAVPSSPSWRYNAANGTSRGLEARAAMIPFAASRAVRASVVRSASSASVRRRRSPRTRSVVSWTAQNTPQTEPSSSRIGL
jgi:hypothetical protein